MLKILVLGSSGMAGHVITAWLEKRGFFDVYNLSRNKFNTGTIMMDVCNQAEFDYFLDACSFDVVVNCIGILNNAAEEYKDRAVYLNSYLPHFLEFRYMETNTRIIHLSTDCVFSGRTGNYSESSFRDGDSFYDRTKAVGEINNKKDLTFRMSIIGPDMNYNGIGLFNWFMKTRGIINGYVNSLWTGITTVELAKAVEKAVLSGLSGLYHLVPRESINKYELLNLFKNKFNRDDISINRYENPVVNKSLVNTRKDFDHIIPSYDEMLDEMKKWIIDHQELYPQYKVRGHPFL